MYELDWNEPYKIQPVTFVPVGNRYAEIDAEDWGKVKNFKWCLFKCHKNTPNEYIYARVSRPQGGILMHRMILGLTDPRIMVDHKNFDGLDNRKSNIRPASMVENHRNQRPWNRSMESVYKGVSLNNNNWQARISVDGERIHLGTFPTEKEAAKAYNNAASKYFGEFAYLNKI